MTCVHHKVLRYTPHMVYICCHSACSFIFWGLMCERIIRTAVLYLRYHTIIIQWMTFYSSSVPDSSFDSLSFISLVRRRRFQETFFTTHRKLEYSNIFVVRSVWAYQLTCTCKEEFYKIQVFKIRLCCWYNMFTKMCEEAFVKGILIRASSLRRRIGCLLNSY